MRARSRFARIVRFTEGWGSSGMYWSPGFGRDEGGCGRKAWPSASVKTNLNTSHSLSYIISSLRVLPNLSWLLTFLSSAPKKLYMWNFLGFAVAKGPMSDAMILFYFLLQRKKNQIPTSRHLPKRLKFSLLKSCHHSCACSGIPHNSHIMESI